MGALFAGLLAHLELFFPVPTSDNESVDAEGLISVYREASVLACRGDPAVFGERIVDFLSTRQEGLSTELIEGLRIEMEDPSPAAGRPSSPAACHAAPAQAPETCES